MRVAEHQTFNLMAKTTVKNTPKTSRKAPKKAGRKKWSSKVTQNSDALDLEPKVFKSRNPLKVARSLKRSSETSKRKKGTPLQSAMSMLNFYINRAGKNLPAKEKKVLEDAKDELRQLYGKPAKK
jgi:hypothetical protein